MSNPAWSLPMRPIVAFALFLAACTGAEPAPVAPPVEPVVEKPADPPPVPDAVPAPANRVFFVEPTDGATVTSPVKVVFGLEGMAIEPAGAVNPGKGHHHVIVDGEPIPAGTAVPADATHIHFGKGQTETTVELTPGPHTLTLQFADGSHLSYGPDMSATIHVTVQ